MSYLIKPLAREQLNSIFAIEQSVQQHPWSVSTIEQSFGARSSNFAIEQQELLAGYLFAQVIVDEAELLNISVGKEYQRQGLASALLTAWFESLQKSSVSRCLLEVRKSNLGAIALYQHLGFTLDGIRKDYYPCANGREDAYLMSRFI